jgi:hypothetical protein
MLTTTQICSVLDTNAPSIGYIKSTKFVPAFKPPAPQEPFSPSEKVLPRLKEFASRVENEPGRF